MKNVVLGLFLLLSMSATHAQTYRITGVSIDWDRVGDVWRTITFQNRKERKKMCKRNFIAYKKEFIDHDYEAELLSNEEFDYSEDEINELLKLRELNKDLEYKMTLMRCLYKLPVRVVEKIERETLEQSEHEDQELNKANKSVVELDRFSEIEKESAVDINVNVTEVLIE